MRPFRNEKAAWGNRKSRFLTWLTFALAVATVSEPVGTEESEYSNEARNERPSWTPDGTSIVFHSLRDGNYELYIMKSDGSGPTNLTSSDEHELFPAVSRSGKRIAFVGASSLKGNYDIYVMDIDGSHRIRLTSQNRVDDWPSWRDDDQTIVFDIDNKGDFAIVRMNMDGSEKRTLIDTNAKTVDPMTTEASEWVVYSSDRLDLGGDRQIYAFNVLNSEIRQLTHNGMTNTAPFISADGTRIVYQAGTDFWKISSMAIDGSAAKQLTIGAYDDKWPAWSPDGAEIAFTSNRDGGWEIYVMNADGSEVRQLTGKGE